MDKSNTSNFSTPQKDQYKNIRISERMLNNSSFEKLIANTISQTNDIEEEIINISQLKEEILKKITEIFFEKEKKRDLRGELLKTPLSKGEKKDISEQIKKIPQEIKNLEKEQERLENINDYYQKKIIKLEESFSTLSKSKTIFQYAKILNNYKENSSNLTLTTSIISPEISKKLQKIIDENKETSSIPEKLRNKSFFFKGENNTGKSSIIKALGNELSRPIYTMRYNDYMNDNGLLSLFLTLTTFLKEQKKTKKIEIEKLKSFDEILKDFENNTITNKEITSIGVSFVDSDGNQIVFDLKNKKEKEQAKKFIVQAREEQKQLTESIKDSCILCIEDLDKIINSSNSYSGKGNLLEPIKTVIEEIRVDNLDIILILQGKSMGSNNEKIKSYIDDTIIFEKITTKEIFLEKLNNILEKYLTEYNINTELPQIDISNISKDFYNIKFIDKLAKEITKTALINKGKNISDKNIQNIVKYLIQQQKKLEEKTGFETQML